MSSFNAYLIFCHNYHNYEYIRPSLNIIAPQMKNESFEIETLEIGISQ